MEGWGHGGGEGSWRRGGIMEEGRGHGGGEGSRRQTTHSLLDTYPLYSPIIT